MSSTQLVTDESGAVVGRYVFGAWGDELISNESIPGILENKFVGGLGCRRDSATGLVYMRHRWYDVGIQRFVSRDPIGLGGGWNLYQYTGSRPLNAVDPSGLQYGGGEVWGYCEKYPIKDNTNGPSEGPGWASTQFLRFVTGSPMVTSYGPKTQQSKDMQTDVERINRGIARWVNVNRARLAKNPNAGLVEVRFFPDDYGDFMNWGLHYGPIDAGTNITRQFVGGYGMLLAPFGDNELRITIRNVTSLKSLTYDIRIFDDNPFGPNGPFHNQTQDYSWNIPRPSLDKAMSEEPPFSLTKDMLLDIFRGTGCSF